MWSLGAVVFFLIETVLFIFLLGGTVATNDQQLKVEFEEDAQEDTNPLDIVDELEDFIDDSDITMTSSAKSGRRSNRKRRRLKKEDDMFDYSIGGHNKVMVV